MKGSLMFDVMYIIIVVFVIGLILLLSHKILSDFNEEANMNEEIKNQTIKKGIATMEGMSNMLPFVVVGMVAISGVLAYMVRVHPVMFIFAIVINIIAIFIGSVLSDAGQEIFKEETLVNSSAKLPFTYQLVQYLPYIGLIACTVIGIASYLGGESEA